MKEKTFEHPHVTLCDNPVMHKFCYWDTEPYLSLGCMSPTKNIMRLCANPPFVYETSKTMVEYVPGYIYSATRRLNDDILALIIEEVIDTINHEVMHAVLYQFVGTFKASEQYDNIAIALEERYYV